MKPLLIGSALALLASPAMASCVIITDSTVASFVHELAHCNGWNHPDSAPWDIRVPRRYIHAYPGPITITITDGGSPRAIARVAQSNAKIKVSRRDAASLCADYGASWSFPIVGCAPFGGM